MGGPSVESMVFFLFLVLIILLNGCYFCGKLENGFSCASRSSTRRSKTTMQVPEIKEESTSRSDDDPELALSDSIPVCGLPIRAKRSDSVQ